LAGTTVGGCCAKALALASKAATKTKRLLRMGWCSC
jgi:hypothetical protein